MNSKLTVFVLLSTFPITSFGLDSFSYSGRLVNSNGSPVTDEVNLRFDLSSTQNISDILCSKTVSNVPLSQGIFNVKLQFLPVDCENNSIQSIMENIPSNHNLVYQVTDLTNSRTYSQQAIYSVPSSFMANFAKSLSSLGATDGQVLMWDAATSKWIPGSAGSGNGTVTGIQTGSGLTGGPINTTGTISIAAGGVEDSHLQGNINPAKIAGARDATMYLKGNNTWSSLGTDALSTILNSFAVITGSTVSSSDTLLQGLGKLQGQVTDLSNNKLDKTGGTLIVGTIDGVPTPVSPNQIVNKSYVDDLVGGVNASQWSDNVSGIHYDQGRVGVGTNDPLMPLHISSTGWGTILAEKISNDNTGGEIHFFKSRGTPGAILPVQANDRLMGLYGIGAYSPNQITSNVAGIQMLAAENFTSTAHGTAIDFGTTDIGTTTRQSRMTIAPNGSIGIGTTNPGALLEVAGQIKITGGVPGLGKILTSDASGLASWSTPGGSTPTGAAGGELSGTYPDPTIANGVITDAKVAVAANIAQSKIANLTTDLSNKQVADSDLTALAGLGTTGVMVRTGAGTATTRSIVGTANRVTVTNGDGVSGNPTINVSPTLLPSPVAGDAGKFLKASGVDTATWGSFLSTDVTTALGFTPVNKAGDNISSGTFDFAGTAVVRVKDPVAATDAANKQYVDNILTAGSNQWGESSGNVYRSTGNVGIGTSSPSFSLTVGNGTSVDGSILAKGFGFVGTDGLVLTESGAGTRLIWYPRKAAFRAGEVYDTKWDDINIGTHSAAFGEDTTASGKYSFAAGTYNTVSGDGSAAFGWNNTASGVDSIAAGEGATASNMATFAFGTSVTASGQRAVAFGESTTASGYKSTAMGYRTTANAFVQTSVGQWNLPLGTENVFSWVATDPLFVVGNGTASGSKSNALMILKNGNIGVGTSTPATKLEVAGQVKITGGTPGAGKVLTSDATGLATWTTVAGGTVTNVSGTAPIAVATGTTTPIVSISQANTTTDGYLSSTDWNTFNNKQSDLSGGATINGIVYPASGLLTLQIPLAPVNLTDAVNLQALNTAINGVTSTLQWTTNGSNIHNNNTGNVGIGTTTPTSIFTVESSATATSGLYYGSRIIAKAIPASSSTGIYLGSSVGTYTPAGYASINAGGSIQGINGWADHYSTNTLNKSIGLTGQSDNQSTGTITSAIGTFGGVFNNSTGTITNGYGLYSEIIRPTGTVTNGYGVFIGNIQATTKYSLYANDSTAPSYFAGNVGIGTTTPAAKLDVAGEVKFGNTSSTCNSTNEGQQRYNSTTKKMEYCNGTSWSAYGSSGISACPTGWAMIGDAGKAATYCIQQDESTAPNFFSAMNTCQGINDSTLGRAHLCTLNEWYTACTIGGAGLVNMTNNTEMVAQTSGTTSYITIGGASCNTFQSDAFSGAWYYRCCIK